MSSIQVRLLKTNLFLLIVFSVIPLCGFSQPGSKAAQTQAVYGLIGRLLPAYKNKFKVELIPKANGKDVFELESKSGKIILRGSNGLSAASALNYYLKTYAHCDVSWNGSNLDLPNPLPVVAAKVRKATPYQYRYYLNYCTFNYSMSWWDWDRWQWEIDWMALNGINMPLAITGQNSVWSRVYKSMGLTDQDLENFFSGPAYFNWFWMGNLDGWGGPLPQSFMQKHEELQKKILARERAFGMTPVLPAFTGHVPPAFKQKFPQAKLKTTRWTSFDKVYILDPSDPMFSEVGKRFVQEEIKTYGTDHLYTADTFNENQPPTNDSTFLNDISKKVYQSMAAADPQAVWIMQAWLFLQTKFWQPAQAKALLNAIPDDKMIILDLWTENRAIWKRTNAYYGKPWIWCMLHNFGGNISLYGRMPEVAAGPSTALKDPKAGRISGIGLTPEAIEQNPVMYELMLENVWRDTPVDVPAWLKGYAHRRYGQQNAEADKAWEVLRQTVYNGAASSAGGNESIITGRPTFNKTSGGTRTAKSYDPAALLPAWQHLISTSRVIKATEGFKYDLVDVTRQVLANYADTVQQLFAASYKKGDSALFDIQKGKFLGIIDDMDRLLGTRRDFLLGKWLNDAKRYGTNESEKRLYEKNARDLITLWGGRNASLREYSNRQWSGMLKGYYKARWVQFFDYLDQCRKAGQPADLKAFEEKIKDWEWQWVNSNENYTEQPAGESIAIANELYQKYYTEIVATYSNQ